MAHDGVRLCHRIDGLDRKLRTSARECEETARLMTIPGIGPITPLAIQAFALPMESFRRGRDSSAWPCLVPQQHTTGGKPRLGRISKMGQKDLGRLLFTGAMTVVRHASRQGEIADPRLARMPLARKPKKVVAVALANRTARGAGRRSKQGVRVGRCPRRGGWPSPHPWQRVRRSARPRAGWRVTSRPGGRSGRLGGSAGVSSAAVPARFGPVWPGDGRGPGGPGGSRPGAGGACRGRGGGWRTPAPCRRGGAWKAERRGPFRRDHEAPNDAGRGSMLLGMGDLAFAAIGADALAQRCRGEGRPATRGPRCTRGDCLRGGVRRAMDYDMVTLALLGAS